MTERVAISVPLPPELHLFARELVEGGSHGSTSEVVRAGLRLPQRQEAGVRPAAPRERTRPTSPQPTDR